MRIGYARVSTIEQDTKLQTAALKKAKCERIITEKASGAKVDRPELARILDIARKGDVLVVWKLDRLARSVRQLIETVQTVLSRYRVDVARLCNEFCAQAAAVAACQVLIASPRNWRSVLREIRCRWTLKVL